MALTKDELELIRAVQSGNEEAWHGLVTRYSKVIWSATKNYNLSFGDREDIVQEVFIRLIHHINSYNPDKASFATWITVITKGICIDKLRQKKACREVLLPPEELERIPSTNKQNANDNTNDTQEMIKILRQIIEEKLKPNEKLVIRLFYMEKLSYSQIAEITGQDYNWVKNILHRTRKYLRKVLTKSNEIIKNQRILRRF